jgi:hypothetical protein
MSSTKLVVLAAIGLSASACSYSTTTTQAPPPAPVAVATVPATTTVYSATTSEQACVDYGFQPGTASYNRCVARDAEYRARGRAPATYTVVQLQSDAQAACSSYGLAPGTMYYDRCVSREIDARRYRDQAYVTPAPAPTTTVYTGASSVTYTPAATTPPAGVQAFRDEYGFRYDGQGNRIDARGNIISPHSTQP